MYYIYIGTYLTRHSLFKEHIDTRGEIVDKYSVIYDM